MLRQSTFAVVDLRFIAWLRFETAAGLHRGRTQGSNEPFNGVVRADVAVMFDQILINCHRVAAFGNLGGDEPPMRFAPAAASRAGGHFLSATRLRVAGLDVGGGHRVGNHRSLCRFGRRVVRHLVDRRTVMAPVSRAMRRLLQPNWSKPRIVSCSVTFSSFITALSRRRRARTGSASGGTFSSGHRPPVHFQVAIGGTFWVAAEVTIAFGIRWLSCRGATALQRRHLTGNVDLRSTFVNVRKGCSFMRRRVSR